MCIRHIINLFANSLHKNCNVVRCACKLFINGGILMNKIMKKTLVCALAAVCIMASSVVTFAAAGFGMTLPSTGYGQGGSSIKESSSTTFHLNISNVENNNNYHFWGYKDGDSASSRQTTDSSAYGTGQKYAYYGSTTAAYNLKGQWISITVKTGPTVFTPMWIEGTFTP